MQLMKNAPRIVRVAALLALAAPLLLAQSRQLRPTASTEPLVALPGNVPSFAQARYDRGLVADSYPANRILLLLRRSPQQQSALNQFLRAAHTPGNALYHQWLTPAEFGERYGPSDADVSRVEMWLEQQGFTVEGVTAGRTAIEFSGTAGQIRQAFHTEIHAYAVGNRVLHANNANPEIPEDLDSLVLGLTPLTDLRPHSEAVLRGRKPFAAGTRAANPQWTTGCGDISCSFPQLLLSPQDFAVQYDLNPLYQGGVNGSGATIGVIGNSNINPTVVATYRSLFSLPATTVNVIVDGNDPGENGDFVESELDVELSGSVAPAAALDLYVAADTTLQSGVALAAQRAVDEDAADVLSVSYGECEQDLGTSGNAFWNGLWEQAAAQGQTVLVASGDNGAATCDQDDTTTFWGPAPVAFQGYTVNGLASTPWNLAIGGTDFYYSDYGQSVSSQQSQLGTYWNLTSTTQPAVSLLQRVPEQPWDRPYGLNVSFPQVEWDNMLAAGGGASNCISGTAASDGSIASCSGGYPKPSWQTGTGVPADGARDLPDVSLFAAAGENDSAYPICIDYYGYCQQGSEGLAFAEVGGTSASTQAMAGIMALIVEKYGRQGQAAYVLYPLAAQHPGDFHDVTVGSNMIACQQGSPDCNSGAGNAAYGNYLLGYDAEPGYDLASGLGSVDASALVSDWGNISFTPTTTSLSLSQTTFAHGTPITAQVSVTGSGGTPTGQVTLVTTASPAVNTGVGTLTLSAGSASGSFSNLPGGQYTVKAQYGGDGVFAASESAPVTVTVTPEPSAITLSAAAWPFTVNGWGSGWQRIASGGSYEYGDPVEIDAQVGGAHGADGTPTGTVTFTAGSLSSGPVTVNSQGVAAWSPANGFPAGSYSITSSYSGDSSFNASSTVTPFDLTVAKNEPWAQGDEGCYGNTVQYGAAFCLISGIHVILGQGAVPTGTLTFLLGTTNLGSGALICCDPPPPEPTPYLYLSNNAFNVTADWPLGTDTITVEYSGDANYNALNFPMTVKVSPALAMSLSANPAVVAEDGSFTATATLTGASGEPSPTGTVSFSLMDMNYGGQLAQGTGAIANGVASYTFPLNLSPSYGSSLSVWAFYGGDSLYGNASATTAITIGPPFALSGTNVANASSSGAQSTITVTPFGGFTGTVNLVCALSRWPPAPSAPPLSCNMNPVAVDLTGSTPATATLSVVPGSDTSAQRRSWLFPGGAAFLAIVVLVGFPERRRWRAFLSLLLVLAFLSGLSACGHSTFAPSSAPGLPPGNYTFTVTGTYTPPASGGEEPSFNEQTQVTMTVQ